MAAHSSRFLRLFVLVIVVVSLSLGSSTVFAQSGTTGSGGYYYTVQPGDTWGNLSWRTGIPTNVLLAANPNALHPYGWLWMGETIYIPGTAEAPTATETETVDTPIVDAGARWYQVKAGESWRTVSRDTGVSMLDLWHANPTHIHPNYWLWTGEWIWIPAVTASGEVVAETEATPETGSEAIELTVTPVITATTTITMTQVVTATIEPTATSTPTAAPTSTLAPTATATETAAPTATSTSVPTPTPSSTPKVLVIAPAVSTVESTAAPSATAPATSVATLPATATPRPSATPLPTATPAESAVGKATPSISIACPATLGGYADAIKEALGTTGTTADEILSWLESCGVVGAESGAVKAAALSTAKANDVVVALNGTKTGSTEKVGMLLVYHAGAKGYTLARSAEGVGSVALMQVGDINLDKKPDIAWTDTTCGAHTCFSTLFVDSWDGKTYRDWIEGEPTMAYGDYTFKDITSAGDGSEIMAHGGVIASTGAGPQRAWTETYISAKGNPYSLHSQVFDVSTCLYHKILDGDQALETWATSGFSPAIAVYKSAIEDSALESCGTITNELDTLRDYARFRLMLSYVASGKSSMATPLLAEIENSDIRGAADKFMESYKYSGSIVQACRDVTTYAKAHPASWQFMADWGYANPSFEAQDLCPLG